MVITVSPLTDIINYIIMEVFLMETYTLIGYQHKQGTYNDIPYDNIIFTCVRDADITKGEIGSVGLLLKVKTSNLDSIPEIGATVSPCYDRFGHVVCFL